MNWSILKDIGTFTLALLIGIAGLIRVDEISLKIDAQSKHINELETRLSMVVTKSNARVPSKLALDNEQRIKVNQNDIDWLKRFAKYLNTKIEK